MWDIIVSETYNVFADQPVLQLMRLTHPTCKQTQAELIVLTCVYNVYGCQMGTNEFDCMDDENSWLFSDSHQV